MWDCLSELILLLISLVVGMIFIVDAMLLWQFRLACSAGTGQVLPNLLLRKGNGRHGCKAHSLHAVSAEWDGARGPVSVRRVCAH